MAEIEGPLGFWKFPIVNAVMGGRSGGQGFQIMNYRVKGAQGLGILEKFGRR